MGRNIEELKKDFEIICKLKEDLEIMEAKNRASCNTYGNKLCFDKMTVGELILRHKILELKLQE